MSKNPIPAVTFGDVQFENVLPDVGVGMVLIANASWINTSEGTVLIDTLIFPNQAEKLREKIIESGGQVKTIIYTHGHFDHVGGASVFQQDSPKVIGHRYLPDRLEKYTILADHTARLNSIQFNFPLVKGGKPSFVYPTEVYDHQLTFKMGDKTFELNHARGETDDATWVWVPELEAAFVGDLLIGAFPNIGNPYKPTRFALPWARALEAIRDKQPKLLISHGLKAVYQGEDIQDVLDSTIEAIHSIHDQVVERINQGVPVDEMIHQVKLPEHLAGKECLTFLYSRPEFAVYNIYRWYHGFFDFNPAHLLPRPAKDVNQEIFKLIGDRQAILSRSQELRDQDQPQLALQVLDVLLQHDPEDRQAVQLRMELLGTISENDFCVMSKNTLVHFMDKDREFLEGKKV